MNKLALALTIVGGINWGLVALFRFDLVAWIFGGSGSLLARIVYTLVGLAAVWCISLLFRETASTGGSESPLDSAGGVAAG